MSSARYVQSPNGLGDYYQANGYSHAVVLPAHARLVVTAGQPGVDIKTGKIPSDPATQFEAAFDNCEVALRAAGVIDGLGSAHKLLCFLTDIKHEPLVMEIWRRRYPNSRPTSAAIGTSGLAAEGMIIEVLVEAHIVESSSST